MLHDFSLNTGLNPSALAHSYACFGRVIIADFLHKKSAQVLRDELRNRIDWRLIVNQGDAIFELDRAAQARLSEQSRRDLDSAIHNNARTGFQYRYETIRIPDDDRERREDDSLLFQFARFMSSPAVLALLQAITGRSGIDFSDAQATAYGPGHFLTSHDDSVPGKHRKAAYVFNLSAEWRAEWGGLLMFHDASGNINETVVPAFNTLSLFSVPQPHSVSYVVPFVPYRRYAVTGWLRRK